MLLRHFYTFITVSAMWSLQAVCDHVSAHLTTNALCSMNEFAYSVFKLSFWGIPNVNVVYILLK